MSSPCWAPMKQDKPVLSREADQAMIDRLISSVAANLHYQGIRILEATCKALTTHKPTSRRRDSYQQTAQSFTYVHNNLA